jgi:hypothetical protein
MKYQIVFLFLTSAFAVINGFSISPAHVARSPRARRRRMQREKEYELERKQREEIKQKCHYLNQQFPIEPNTCPAMIVDNYMTLYSPVHELREYQFKNCFVNPIVISFYYKCFMWFLIILFGISVCMTA